MDELYQRKDYVKPVFAKFTWNGLQGELPPGWFSQAARSYSIEYNSTFRIYHLKFFSRKGSFTASPGDFIAAQWNSSTESPFSNSAFAISQKNFINTYEEVS